MDKNNKQVIIASIDNLSIERTIVLPQNTEEIVKYRTERRPGVWEQKTKGIT